MNADPQIDTESMNAEMTGPLYFDSGDHRLFGWLHSGAGTDPPKIGLVVCKPFGYEAVCAHRSVRAFSQAAAKLGVPTLRFDYAGTSDSSEIDFRADQLEIWVQDIDAAIAELRRLTGVERVYLLGIRMGALLATLAAGRCKIVDGLILVAPITTGRRYLRELRTARMAASIGSESRAGSSSTASDGAATNAGPTEASGFRISGATLEAIASVDLKAQGAPPVADMLIIDGISMPGARAWAEDLVGQGVRTSYRALPGLVEMIMTGPQFASVPTEMIAAMSDWLTELLNASPKPKRAYDQSFESPQIPLIRSMNLTFDGAVRHAAVSERPVFLSSEAMLFGIVTEPTDGEIRRRAVILVNAGADYHIGASGMYVGFARGWARRGYVVLRMDLAGLGDSSTRLGQPDNVVFPPAAMDDIRVAIDWVRSQYGISDITLGGVCSGAYHALRAAIVRLPINRILMVNPETYFWNETMSIHDMQPLELVGKPKANRNKIFSVAAWKRLVIGQVNIRYILRRTARRLLLAVESAFRDGTRRLHIRLPRDLGWELEDIGARGVRMVFVFGRGEPGIALLKIQGGVSLKRLGGRCRIHIIDDADHVFSKSDSRLALERILSEELFAPIERNAAYRADLHQAAPPPSA